MKIISLLFEPLRWLGILRDNRWLMKNSPAVVMMESLGIEVTGITRLIEGYRVHGKWQTTKVYPDNSCFIDVYPGTKNMTTRGIIRRITNFEISVIRLIADLSNYQVFHAEW